MPSKKVFYPCHRCLMRVHINQCYRRQHIQLYGLPDDNKRRFELEDDVSSSISSVSQDWNEDQDEDQNEDQNEEIEDDNSVLSESDINMDSINEFDYWAFSRMELPDNYKRNFADLASKARCNVSDNAYDQMKYTKGEDFWSLKVCRKRLFDISGIESINIDCCRNGKYPCSKPSIFANMLH